MTSTTTPHDTIDTLTLRVAEHLQSDEFEAAAALIAPLHPGDLAHVIQYLPPSLRALLISKLYEHVPSNVFSYLDESVREELLPLLPPKALAQLVGRLASDDALSLLDDLSHPQKTAVLHSISHQKRQRYEVLQNYPKDTAARLMQAEMIVVPVTWTAKKALSYITTNKQTPRNVYEIFLVTDDWQLVGIVLLADLMRAAQNTPLKKLMSEETYAVDALETQENIVRHFQRYSLISAPVVDKKNHLLGIITADDVLSVLDKEAEEDIMHLGGVGASDFYAPVLSTTLARFQWLLITFLNTLLASAVISQFQMVLEKKVALAILMPIVAAMGGNAGTQVVTVVVRALATQELGVLNMGRTLVKSLAVSLLNGFLFAIILSAIAIVWFGDWSLGLVLGSALLLNMVWAGVAGTLLPILVSHMNLDPALSAGPILTTTTDVLGFSIFLGLAKMFVL